ncbi:MAG: pyruvate kinase [bacterium]|nr:pyruvate kinase [bacterium]
MTATPRTRILATLGPASAGEDGIRALLEAGVDAFRLNFSHGTHAEHGRTIAAIRRVAAGRPIAILQDLGGPKLRLRRPVRGEPGDVVEIALPASVVPGDPVLLADGVMQLEVVAPGRARVVTEGDIPAGKGINLPSSRLDDVPSLTPKDEADLRFGVEQGVDWVALSFVRRASDLAPVKATGLPVVAKIEKAHAVENLDEIVEAADAVMVARGDLGVEIPIERVPTVQKRLIAATNRAGKPVITATQMLRSMVESRLPTRAEATDVANAVLDGTDVVMLSEETAIGAHPSLAVAMMRRIVLEAERILPPRLAPADASVDDLIASQACEVAARLDAAAIVVPTRTGFTATQVASHRPGVPIVALTVDEALRRRLALVWGVTACTTTFPDDAGAGLAAFRAVVRGLGIAPAGASIVLVGGWPFGAPGGTNLLHVARL